MAKKNDRAAVLLQALRTLSLSNLTQDGLGNTNVNFGSQDQTNAVDSLWPRKGGSHKKECSSSHKKESSSHKKESSSHKKESSSHKKESSSHKKGGGGGYAGGTAVLGGEPVRPPLKKIRELLLEFLNPLSSQTITITAPFTTITGTLLAVEGNYVVLLSEGDLVLIRLNKIEAVSTTSA